MLLWITGVGFSLLESVGLNFTEVLEGVVK